MTSPAMAGGKRLLASVADGCFDGAIELDGAIGGGQVLRLALALSALCSRAVRVHSIRKGRGEGGGLAAQHLAGVRLVADLTRGDVAGDALRSTEVAVSHAALRGGFFRADPGSAGSCMLLVQVALPILAFAPIAESAASGRRKLQNDEHVTGACQATEERSPSRAQSELVLVGGTDALWAPPVDYTSQVLFPVLKKWFGVDARLHLHKRGFFPKGQGEVRVRVTPLPAGATLTPMDLTDRGEITSLAVSAFHAGKVSRDVAQRMVDAASKELATFKVPIRRNVSEAFSAAGDGCGVLCWAETSTGARLGSSEVGQRGKRAEELGREAGRRLAADLLAGACVDEHTQDQIVAFMALAKGKSRLRVGCVTEHTLAAMRVAEAVLGAHFETEGDEGDVVLSCEGVGLLAPSEPVVA